MASPGTPKTMSSRLLTMKFMQRAAASTPSSSAPSTPTADDQSSKRRKVEHNSAPQPEVDDLVNQAAIKAAIAEEEKKVEAALLKRAEELGDAHWVLQMPDQTKSIAKTPLKVVQVGFAQIDSSDAADDADPSHHSVPALRRYNMDKKKAGEKKTNSTSNEADSESESDSESDSDTSSSEATPARQSFGSNSRASSAAQSATRKILKGKKSAEKLRAVQFQEKRRKKEVNLNKGGITSISAGGATPSFRQPVSLTCYNCNQPGHKASECKKPRNQQGR
ncbi:hypothetical protein GGS20DRAFT_269935 [Poronia punctata]|nr:hypothetical protein GGS20DRAFT_269935 [Poronia punctata]